jgi:hypothetical protein
MGSGSVAAIGSEPGVRFRAVNRKGRWRPAVLDAFVIERAKSLRSRTDAGSTLDAAK